MFSLGPNNTITTLDGKQLQVLFLDFESYYCSKTGYTLRKMPTPNYILDPRWETIMCSAATGMGQATIIDGPDFERYIGEFDPRVTATVTFNAMFDNSILAWHYGFIPALMFDAMGMARALRGHLLKHGASLEAVGRDLGYGDKGHTVAKVDGMTRQAIIDLGLWDDYKAYCVQDTAIMQRAFWDLLPEFPEPEWRVQDLVLRTTIQPRFMLDTDLLRAHLRDTKARKEELLRDSGVERAEIMSTPKFKALLEARGIEVGLKPNPKGDMIPAFAKTDEFMASLQDHWDPTVRVLAATRLGLKSTLEESRCEKMLSIAELDWGKARLPIIRELLGRVLAGEQLPLLNLMPIPLQYGTTHTHRLSGGWGLNMQNMPRGSKLRYALVAPPGFMCISGDLAQIEARLVAWICRVIQMLETFERKEDPYAKFATQVFGFPVDKKTQPHGPDGTSIHRFIGKTGVLGLGYGCGADHFFEMVKKLARALKIDLTSVNFDEQLSRATVNAYRKINAGIPHGWHTLDRLLTDAFTMGHEHKFGPVTISHGTVEGPSGLKMKYIPCRDMKDGSICYRYGKNIHHIYGAKMLENIVQFLARLIIMNAALRLACRGYRFVLQAHDELVFVVPEEDVDNAKQIIHRELTRRPSWAPDLPLDASIGSGKSYGDCK